MRSILLTALALCFFHLSNGQNSVRPDIKKSAIRKIKSIFPASIIDFRVIRLSKGVIISWHTESEPGKAGFSVERRGEDEAVFSPIGFLPSKSATGDNASLNDYSFVDSGAGPGICYYRIRQNEPDGTNYYTMVKEAGKKQKAIGQ